ncbi:MAG TPA: M14 metallopeptidase family protein [Bryobacteraceae bacterium]|jgi:hypothetical protein
MKHSRSLILLLLASLPAAAQVPTPESVLGHKPTDDFWLATYEESLQYFRALEKSSDHIKLVEIGKSTRGREWWVALISNPENLRQIDKYKQISGKLARAEGLTDAEAHALAKEGKPIVHIDGGLHATEVAGVQHCIELAYQLLSKPDDPVIKEILDNEIVMLWPSINPDGTTAVSSWYRKNVGTAYEVSPLPELYQEYVGHDNNRDGYMQNMIESQTVVKTQLEYWPVIMYTQHQTAPFPGRIYLPPYGEPISGNINPLMWRWLNKLGTSMAAYLDGHGMPGSMHEGRFDVWYSGYLDNIGNWRNQISFFTETALYRYATPRFYTVDEFPKDRQDLRAEVTYASPWRGGWWRIADAVHYMVGGSMSVMTTAAKYHEELLWNRYQAGRDTIARFKKEPPFAYVIPMQQHDDSEASALAEKLLLNGIEVKRAKTELKVGARQFAAGSYVVLMDQPFALLVKDLFEPQKYPDLGELPYDVTGWTLPMQMGVEVAPLTDPVAAEVRGELEPVTSVAPYTGPFTRDQNASFRVINRSLSGKQPLVSGEKEKFEPMPKRAPKLGLYRPWTASIDEGWTRWILEQYEFPFTSLRNADIQAGHLHDRFDAIIIPDMGPRTIADGFPEGSIPGQYAGGLGAHGSDQLREFVEGGGTLITFNNASMYAIDQFRIPLTNVLAGLKPDEFSCSGALLRIILKDPADPLVKGLTKDVTVMFERGPAFETKPEFKGKILASYPASPENPLQSGYIRHPEKIEGKAAAVDASVGAGHVILIGFKPQWRAQSHGSYKFFFNAIYGSVK